MQGNTSATVITNIPSPGGTPDFGSDPEMAALLERLRREPPLRSWVMTAPTGALASLGVALDDHELVHLLDQIEAMDDRPLPVTARDVMTPDLITIRPEQSVHDAAEVLSEHRISGLPVCDEAGALVGIVSEFDLIARSGTTVGDVMSREVTTVSEGATLDQVRTTLVSRRLKRLPVLDRDGKLIGLISRADLVRELAYRWQCTRCGNLVRARRPPEGCPRCGAANSYQDAPPPAAIVGCPTCGRPMSD